MKYSLLVVLVAVAGCASPPPPAPIPPPPPERASKVGQSQMTPKAAAQCIGSKWAQTAGQPAMIQYVFANDTAFDVYVPGQTPPAGTAAMVRPAPTGTGSTLYFRGNDPTASSVLSQCP